MRRRRFIGALAAAAVAAPALAQAEGPEALVRALYAAHMPSIQGNSPGVLDSAQLRRRFLTPALAAAIVRNREASRRAGALLDDTLDFDPITDSQDPEVRDLQVRQVSVEGERATVAAMFTRGENERVTLNYILARIDGTWRVYDITKPPGGGHEGWSVRRIIGLRN